MGISSLFISFSRIKKASSSVPRTPGDSGVERTGLEPWYQATTSVSVRERQKKCRRPNSQFFFWGTGERPELLTNVHTLILIRNQGRIHILGIELRFLGLNTGLTCGPKSPISWF